MTAQPGRGHAAAHRGRPDRGAGSVLVLAAVTLAVTLAVAATGLAQALVARHRAESAADLAALAAASVWPAPDCGRARVVASTNGAALTGCTVESASGSVRVGVSVGLDGPWRRIGAAAASARAGPDG